MLLGSMAGRFDDPSIAPIRLCDGAWTRFELVSNDLAGFLLFRVLVLALAGFLLFPF